MFARLTIAEYHESVLPVLRMGPVACCKLPVSLSRRVLFSLIVGQVGRAVGVIALLIVGRVVGVGDCHELVGQAKV